MDNVLFLLTSRRNFYFCNPAREAHRGDAGLFSNYAQQAEEPGLPIVGKFYPAGTGMMPEVEFHESIMIGIVWQLFLIELKE